MFSNLEWYVDADESSRLDGLDELVSLADGESVSVSEVDYRGIAAIPWIVESGEDL